MKSLSVGTGSLALIHAFFSSANGFLILPLPELGQYLPLWNLCMSGGANSYVGVDYEGGSNITFNYGQCYPYEMNGNLAQVAVFCRSVTCENNPNPDCSGGAIPPVPVPLPAGLVLINELDFVQIIGQGATCQKNDLLI